MGQAWARSSTDVSASVASYLAGSDVRAGLCALRTPVECTEAVYAVLASSLSSTDPELDKKLQRAREINADLVPKKRYWRLQTMLCEACRAHSSCTRSPCQKCCRKPGRHSTGRHTALLELRILDICCSCAKKYMARSQSDSELAGLAEAYDAWKAHCCSRPHHRGAKPGHLPSGRKLAPRLPSKPFVPNPPTALGICGGLLVFTSVLQRDVPTFWKALQEARLHRRQNLQENVDFCAGLGVCLDAVSAHLETLLERSHPDDELPIVLWARAVVQEALDSWEQVPLGQEAQFLQQERQVVGVLKRAIQLLVKAERLNSQPFRAAVLKGIGVKPERKELHMEDAARLDALSEVLTGSPVTDEKRGLEVLRQHIACSLIEHMGMPALFAVEKEANELIKRLEAARRFDLATVARQRAPLAPGFTVAEVWCGNPGQFLKDGRVLVEGEVRGAGPQRQNNTLRGFVEQFREHDPNREEAVANLAAAYGRSEFWHPELG